MTQNPLNPRLLKVLLLLSLLSSKPSFAIVGTDIKEVAPETYPFACLIKIENSDDEQICSGTLISSTQVLSAGHCFGKNATKYSANISVTCGKSAPRAIANLQLPEAALWYVEINGFEKPFQNSDYSVLTLDSAIPKEEIEPMPIAKSGLGYIQGQINQKPHCKILGFGTDNSGQMGTLHEGSTDDLPLILFDEEAPFSDISGRIFYRKNTLINKNGGQEITPSFGVGDSGGSLICQIPGSPAQLVGIIGSYAGLQNQRNSRVLNVYTPAWLVPLDQAEKPKKNKRRKKS